MRQFSAKELIASGRRTIRLEQEAVAALEERIGDDFVRACQLILSCKGRVVVTGMGKSGHIGRKIAATLASTGTPAFFVHPGEASHGDLGMITRGDLVMAISNSGNSPEILTLLPILKRLGIPMITMTGKPHSPLAEAAEVSLDIHVASEACPLDLAPTSSTTATLVMGDALAVALLEARGFTAEDFALSHPGGILGRRLLLRVNDLIHAGDQMPKVQAQTSLLDALSEITAKGLGMTTVVGEDGTLLGVFTDGDLRRAVDKGHDIRQVTIENIMTRKPTTVHQDALAAEALTIMENRKITALVVIDEHNHPVGVIHMHDLLRAGLV
ncbi:KpsF/GutQ family sugar-phosphate isomerase [Saccharophagus sp. K07]|jgi:arabinose-5-phosphate isomerase|uniref:KpsF/GutQ family sugar-phosphate isomerase n=1 Tax=Saccharophagus sp. K07 TaxID=2283636 RepID=UPI00165247C6|nr:KpsF/GutQ family sugar-phosphate isomerase [Saccharophagus sp. K07]MBC6907299.1 KpsF/GutQ family sugar-phosphate isomerase [Saccharophagus sp. K07]